MRRSTKFFFHPAFLLTVRIAVGALFATTGVLKAIAPPEEFAAVIRTYQMLPEHFLVPIATVLPWIEMVCGLFFALGLWTRWSARAVTGILSIFTIALGAAWARGINLEDCGCFGSLGFKETGHEAFIRNVVLLAFLVPVLMARDFPWSLDRFLSGRNGTNTKTND